MTDPEELIQQAIEADTDEEAEELLTRAGETRPRKAFFVDETFMTPSGIVPAMVEEGVPGFGMMLGNGELARPWFWGMDIATAQSICNDANAGLGLTPAEAQEIVTSSIRAQNLAESAQLEANERWQQIKREG